MFVRLEQAWIFIHFNLLENGFECTVAFSHIKMKNNRLNGSSTAHWKISRIDNFPHNIEKQHKFYNSHAP